MPTEKEGSRRPPPARTRSPVGQFSVALSWSPAGLLTALPAAAGSPLGWLGAHRVHVECRAGAAEIVGNRLPGPPIEREGSVDTRLHAGGRD